MSSRINQAFTFTYQTLLNEVISDTLSIRQILSDFELPERPSPASIAKTFRNVAIGASMADKIVKQFSSPAGDAIAFIGGIFGVS